MWYVRKEGAERSRLFGKIKVCAIARVSLQTSRLDHHAELYLETLQAEPSNITCFLFLRM
jgi:hypothetical protein